MNPSSPSPAEICRALLAALDASEGRRKPRQRDTTPDAIGMAVKRELLERACQDDPGSESFEVWLMNYCTANSSTMALRTLVATACKYSRSGASQTNYRSFANGSPRARRPAIVSRARTPIEKVRLSFYYSSRLYG